MNPTIPKVDLNQTPTAGNGPFGAFKLSQCDGPDMSGVTAQMTVDYAGKTYTLPGQLSQLKDAGYRPCNFEGAMVQVQFIVNAMLVLGVVAAVVGFSYAGVLYVSGSVDKRKLAHSIFPKVFWGFIIMLTAWFMVHQILLWLTPNGSAYLR
jgi:hypothetical protein